MSVSGLTYYLEEHIMKKKIVIIQICLLISLPFLGGACADMTPAQKGAVAGTVVGAASGGLLLGSRRAAVIGAGVGALGGALLNDELNKGK